MAGLHLSAAELNTVDVSYGRCDGPELSIRVGAAREVNRQRAIRSARVEVIQDIERLGLQLQDPALTPHFEIFVDTQVEGLHTRPIRKRGRRVTDPERRG